MPDPTDSRTIRNDWYETTASEPIVTLISHYAADKLNAERRAEAEAEFAAWVEEVSRG